MPDTSLPDFDRLWNYEQPAQTEAVFRELLPNAEASGDQSYHLQLLTQIARAVGLQRRFDEARALLHDVESGLTDDLVVPRIRFFLESGRVENSSGEITRGRAWFDSAWNLAQGHGETAYAIDAAHMLAIISDPAEQMQWNLTALALAEAATDPRAHRWCGSLYNNIGWSYHDAGDFPRALEMFEKAVRWRQAEGNIREIRIARWCVGRCMRSLGRVEDALALQQQLLREYAASGDTPDGYVQEEMGECLLALGRDAESLPFFAEAYALLSQDPWLVAQEPGRLARLQTLAANSS